MRLFLQKFILSIIFILILTPVATILRLLGLDLLDQRINKKVITYWKIKKNSNIDMNNQS